MNGYLHFAAWVVIVVTCIRILFEPMFIGEPKKQTHNTYGEWVFGLIGAALLLPLAIHALAH